MAPRMVELKGTHYEIGVQHGNQLKDIIRETVIPFVKTEISKHGVSEDDMSSVTKKYASLIEKDFPEIITETRGIADGAEIDYETALLVLLFWEVRDTGSPNHTASSELASRSSLVPDCSSFVAAGDATVDGIPLASQNSDWPLSMHGKGLGQVFHVSPQDRYRFIGRGLAGNLGRPSVIGFNEEGLAFVGSGIVQFRGAGFGLPSLMITRTGLETCKNVEEFLQLVKRIPSWAHSGENVDIIDSEGNMARISFSTKRVCIVETKNHFMVSTNHYHNQEMSRFGPASTKDYMSTFTRYERLIELLWDNYGEIDSEKAKSIMSDHKYGNEPPDGNNSICRHGATNETLGNMLSLPNVNEFWMSEGTPCRGKYIKYRL